MGRENEDLKAIRDELKTIKNMMLFGFLLWIGSRMGKFIPEDIFDILFWVLIGIMFLIALIDTVYQHIKRERERQNNSDK